MDSGQGRAHHVAARIHALLNNKRTPQPLPPRPSPSDLDPAFDLLHLQLAIGVQSELFELIRVVQLDC